MHKHRAWAQSLDTEQGSVSLWLGHRPESQQSGVPAKSFFFFFPVFIGLHLRHMEVPRLGVESEP